MRFMFLIHHDEAASAQMSQADWQRVGAEYVAFNAALIKAGGNPGERLEGSHAATSVRHRAGKAEVLDGPYADTREQFAGYFTMDLPDLDQAVAWAARCPSAQFGCVEIRPMHAGHNG